MSNTDENTWITPTQEIRNFLSIQEQKNTATLNEIKRIYDPANRLVEYIKNGHNIFFGLYSYNKYDEYYECNSCYKYNSQSVARWKLLKMLNSDEFEYLKIDAYTLLIKLSNHEIVYIYNNENTKRMATFHFENIQEFSAWVKSDDKYHFIFELTSLRNYIKKGHYKIEI